MTTFWKFSFAVLWCVFFAEVFTWLDYKTTVKQFGKEWTDSKWNSFRKPRGITTVLALIGLVGITTLELMLE